ncbi:MAG: hypothetical protein RLZZ299_3104 [Pseudomonadota bacterium]
MRPPERTLRFHALLGRGGFGAVYLATLHGAAGFRRRVAIKLLHAELETQEDLRARQRDEARLLGLLHHPALVAVLELASVGRRPAVVMEYVEAVDLVTLAGALPSRRIPLRALATLIAVVADVLDSAWRARDPDDGRALRVVHRDIKPSNLLLTADGQVKVLDFGIARFEAADREGRTTRLVLGTPRYMAPESWDGGPPDHALDVYALGVTAWELWTGRGWQRSPDRAHHERQIAEAAALHTGLPPALDALFAAMVAWDPARRPSARDVHTALVAWSSRAASSGGDPLPTLAARHVPPLRAAREAAMAREALPPPAALTFATPVGADRRPTRPRAARLLLAAATVLVLAVLAGVVARTWDVPADAPSMTPPTRVGIPTPTAPTRPDAAEAGARVAPQADAPSPPRTAGARPRPARTPAPVPSAPTPGDDATPVAAAEPAPMDAPPPAVSARDTRARSSFRIVTVPPEATAWLDGQRLGPTPVVLDALAAGTHHVEVELDGTRARTEVVTGSDGVPGIRYDYALGSWRTLR